MPGSVSVLPDIPSVLGGNKSVPGNRRLDRRGIPCPPLDIPYAVQGRRFPDEDIPSRRQPRDKRSGCADIPFPVQDNVSARADNGSGHRLDIRCRPEDKPCVRADTPWQPADSGLDWGFPGIRSVWAGIQSELQDNRLAPWGTSFYPRDIEFVPAYIRSNVPGIRFLLADTQYPNADNGWPHWDIRCGVWGIGSDQWFPGIASH